MFVNLCTTSQREDTIPLNKQGNKEKGRLMLLLNIAITAYEIFIAIKQIKYIYVAMHIQLTQQ